MKLLRFGHHRFLLPKIHDLETRWCNDTQGWNFRLGSGGR